MIGNQQSKKKNQIKNFQSDLKFPIKGSNSKFHITWLLIFDKKFTSWMEEKGLRIQIPPGEIAFSWKAMIENQGYDNSKIGSFLRKEKNQITLKTKFYLLNQTQGIQKCKIHHNIPTKSVFTRSEIENEPYLIKLLPDNNLN